MKYYTLKKINATNAQYRMIIGERSNGKTYAALTSVIDNYVKNGKQGAYVRRWREDFVGKRGMTLFKSIISNGYIEKVTDGEYNTVKYYASAWYLAYSDGTEFTNVDINPFCYGFSITSMEHDKSTSYPDITMVIFDEFISRNGYVPDEFILFMNTLSTIIRERSDVIIYLLGNTVNKYCPYFKEMGLNHIKEMQQGTIDVYEYGKDSQLKVAVEYCKNIGSSKESNVYFSFDNPRLNMITGGVWEVDVYPHLPFKYNKTDIIFTYYITFNNDNLTCHIIQKDEQMFTFIMPKTTDLRYSPEDIVFNPVPSSLPNVFTHINRPVHPIIKKLYWFFSANKVFYSSNEVGEIVRNYLMWCNGQS